jgi:hypothetical protein
MGCGMASAVSGKGLVVDGLMWSRHWTFVFLCARNFLISWKTELRVWDQGTSLLQERVARSTRGKGYLFGTWKEAKQDNILPPRLNLTKISHGRTWSTRKSTNQLIILRPKAVRNAELLFHYAESKFSNLNMEAERSSETSEVLSAGLHGVIPEDGNIDIKISLVAPNLRPDICESYKSHRLVWVAKPCL